MACFRCGRRGHRVASCYASTDVDGVPISDDEESDDEESDAENELKLDLSGVYALVTESGMHYVGKSTDVHGRINMHRNGNGAMCLSGANFTRVSLLTQGQTHDLESWERDETLTRMLHYGIDNVRGWMFVSNVLSGDQRKCAFDQVCERFDLCRKCGRDSHFASACFARSNARWAM